MATVAGDSTRKKFCALCQSRDHWAEKCRKFESPEDRRDRFYFLGLCFKCARNHDGGLLACTSSWRCGAKVGEYRCTRNHHIALHEYYENRAAAGLPSGSDRGRSRSRDQESERGRSQSGDRGRSQSRERGRSRSQSQERRTVRFVDEKERNSGNSESRA